MARQMTLDETREFITYCRIIRSQDQYDPEIKEIAGTLLHGFNRELYDFYDKYSGYLHSEDNEGLLEGLIRSGLDLKI